MTFLFVVGAVVVGMFIYEFLIWWFARKFIKSKKIMSFMAGD